MAAASQVFATRAGLDILRSGGNAADAAIAANTVLGGYQAVMHDGRNGVLTGASDPRKDGQAAEL